jgi:hypothetical protein
VFDFCKQSAHFAKEQPKPKRRSQPDVQPAPGILSEGTELKRGRVSADCTRVASLVGAEGENRTRDPLITNEVLYQLSYLGWKYYFTNPISLSNASLDSASDVST